MKILLLGPLPPPFGGTTNVFAQLVRDLDETPHIELVVVATNADKSKGLRSFVLDPLRSLALLARQIPGIDVVTFHASNRRMQYFGPLLYAMCRLFRKPLIVRCFGGSLDQVHADSWRARLFLGVLFRADCVLVETELVASYFREHFPKANIVRFANNRPLPDLDALRKEPHARQGSSDRLRLVFLGEVKPTKGVRELAAICARLATEVSVDIYGPLLDGVEQTEFDGMDGAWYRGEIHPDRVYPALHEYDALVLPTTYRGEGYPGVILEAFMVGTPVVATRWRAIPEIVQDGVNGLLIDPDDLEASLENALSRLARSPELLRELSEGALAHREDFLSARWNRQVFVELCASVTEAEVASLDVHE